LFAPQLLNSPPPTRPLVYGAESDHPSHPDRLFLLSSLLTWPLFGPHLSGPPLTGYSNRNILIVFPLTASARADEASFSYSLVPCFSSCLSEVMTDRVQFFAPPPLPWSHNYRSGLCHSFLARFWGRRVFGIVAREVISCIFDRLLKYGEPALGPPPSPQIKIILNFSLGLSHVQKNPFPPLPPFYDELLDPSPGSFCLPHRSVRKGASRWLILFPKIAAAAGLFFPSPPFLFLARHCRA